MSGTVQNPTDDEEVTSTEEVEETEETEAKSEKAKEQYSADEYKSLDARMRAADKNRSQIQKQLEEAQAQLAEIEKAKLSDLEKAQAKNTELEKKTEALVTKLKEQALENAFLSTRGVEWADSEDAYTVLQRKYMDGVEIDDDGKVTGMAEAIKAMAKAKPYLVKSTNGETVTPSSEATGQTPAKRKGEQNKPDRASMTKRFPALGKK